MIEEELRTEIGFSFNWREILGCLNMKPLLCKIDMISINICIYV